MLNKLQSFMRSREMVQPGDRVICAVSGGADSVALLFAMYLLRESLGISLEAAHFNHGLRGQESDADEAFVRVLCQRYDIPLSVGAQQVRPGKKGLEASARDARYRYLRSLGGKIATAHTADDNAETVLMHLVRGTGLKGLGGITPVGDQLIRPMLTVTRQEVMDFLQEYHLGYISDSSNDTDDFLRNRLRHHVMPLLKEENPRLAQNVSAMALRLREDEQALAVHAPQTADVQTLRNMLPALRSRSLSAFLERCGVPEPEASHIVLAEKLVFSEKPSAKAEFPGNVTICRNYGCLEKEEKQLPLESKELPCPGLVELSGWRITCKPADTLHCETDGFTVCPQGQILVRHRLSGDALTLPGGTKSLKKLFIDRKIPANLRDTVPVIADEGGVLGVCGIGPDRKRLAKQLPAVELRFERIEKERLC